MHFYQLHLFSVDEEPIIELSQELDHYRNHVFDYYEILKFAQLKELAKSLSPLEQIQFDLIFKDQDSEADTMIEITEKNWEVLYSLIELKMESAQKEYNYQLQDLITNMTDKTICSLNDLDVTDRSLEWIGLNLSSMGKIIGGEFSSYSYFYNWMIYSGNTTRQTIEKYARTGGVYLAFIDFHN